MQETPTHCQDSLFDSFWDLELVNVDIPRLPNTMRTIKCLVLGYSQLIDGSEGHLHSTHLEGGVPP